MTLETKLKLSRAKLGKKTGKRSKATCKKIAEAVSRSWTPKRRREWSQRLKDMLAAGEPYPHTGHHHTEAHKKYMSRLNTGRRMPKVSEGVKKDWARLTTKQRNEKTLPGLMASRKAHPKFSPLEPLVKSALRKLKVHYKSSVPLGIYVIDILLVDHKVALECDGNFWHSTHKWRKRDRRKDYFLRRQGIQVARLKEPQIRKNAMVVTTKVLKRLGIL